MEAKVPAPVIVFSNNYRGVIVFGIVILKN
jgi:hypothetical protein